MHDEHVLKLEWTQNSVKVLSLRMDAGRFGRGEPDLLSSSVGRQYSVFWIGMIRRIHCRFPAVIEIVSIRVESSAI